ncbi:Non-specific lipid-transfer protein [Nymphaea thermarum]|nr:Non-specific lipid-transfer protein [Nymphaea thermarum]
MAGSSFRSLVWWIVACLLVSLLSPTTAELTCDAVVPYVAPCLPFTLNGGTVSDACCAGIRGLNALAKLRADRVVACQCIKNAASAFPAINMGRLNMLPRYCGVKLPVSNISPNIDCSRFVQLRALKLNRCLKYWSVDDPHHSYMGNNRLMIGMHFRM